MSDRSLLDLQNWSPKDLEQLFFQIDHEPKETAEKFSGSKKTAALIFLEPSTRTRLSFELACAKENIDRILLDAGGGSSLEKGETLEDTFLNVAAMKPDLLIVRVPEQFPLKEITEELGIPTLNGGWGKRAHPTQALLDIATIYKEKNINFSKFNKLKLLFTGDVLHSRVFSSHQELAKILGYEIGVACPEQLKVPGTKYFTKLSEGLQWADVVMALRTQKERHDGKKIQDSDINDYQLNSESLKKLSKDALILHPGPVNWGTELSINVVNDSRNKILKQVEMGVTIRRLLVRRALAGKL